MEQSGRPIAFPRRRQLSGQRPFWRSWNIGRSGGLGQRLAGNLGGFTTRFLGGALGLLGREMRSRLPFASPLRRDGGCNNRVSVRGNLRVDVVNINRTP